MSALANDLQVDIDATLDDLLSRWHHWQQGARVTRGFNTRSTVTGYYLVSTQYDSDNGMLDDAIDDARSRAVDHEVNQMLHPWRMAIYILARNLNTGLDVWSSRRLPHDETDLALIVATARAQLVRRLSRAGVM